MVVAGAEGSLGLGRRRHPLPRLLRPAGQHQHRPPAPQGRRRDPGAGRAARHGRAAARQRRPRRGGPADRRARAPGDDCTTCSSPTAAPTPIENAVRMARLHTGRRKVLATLPQLPRQHPDGDQPHRRPAALGQRLRRRRRACTSSARSSTARAFHATTEEEECERALQHLEQTIALEGPATIAAIVLETIPGTAGIMVPPPGYLAGVRELCDRYGIMLDRRRGDGRLRPRRRVVRLRRWAASRPDLVAFAKGVNSGYVPLGGVIVSRRDLRDLRAARRSPAA